MKIIPTLLLLSLIALSACVGDIVRGTVDGAGDIASGAVDVVTAPIP
jgi:hypothetical protein